MGNCGKKWVALSLFIKSILFFLSSQYFFGLMKVDNILNPAHQLTHKIDKQVLKNYLNGTSIPFSFFPVSLMFFPPHFSVFRNSHFAQFSIPQNCIVQHSPVKSFCLMVFVFKMSFICFILAQELGGTIYTIFFVLALLLACPPSFFFNSYRLSSI